jgi:wyosine [tRNA(Phe)-imidazoG37] synthetase (radical SAM superfamily)
LNWVLRRYNGGIKAILKGRVPAVPLQVEIHPFHRTQPMGCNNRCVWCTRLEDKNALKASQIEGIQPDRLIAFIVSLKGSGLRRIVLSGNSTEPLLYPRIDEVIRTIHATGMNWVLYTNLYYGRRIIDAVLDCAQPGDVLRVSLDAGNEASYLKTHRPQNDPQAFRTVVANLTEILSARAMRQSPLTVGIAYLMTADNSSEEELCETIERAQQIGVDFIRFSVPLKPTHQNPEFALAEAEAGRIKRRINRLVLEYELRGGRTKIEILEDDVIQGAKSFARCHHCKLIPVIGVRGKVYPCTSTSTADFDYLGIGDINQPDFPTQFWEIWRDSTKWQHDVHNCPDCTRFECDLNMEIDRRLALAGGQNKAASDVDRVGMLSGTKTQIPINAVLKTVP